MAPILETRSLKISRVILSLEDVHRLAVAAEEQFQKKGHSYISYNVECSDGSKFESSSSEIFEKGSKSGNKHGNNYENYIEITGPDGVWVNGLIGTFTDILQSCKPQEAFVYEYAKVVQFALALGIGTVYNAFLDLLPGAPIESRPTWAIHFGEFLHSSPLFFYLFRYFLGALVGWMPAKYLLNKLQSLWPTVELQIGPEHVLVEKRRRQWFIGLGILIVIPFLVSLFYDVAKWWALRPGEHRTGADAQ